MSQVPEVGGEAERIASLEAKIRVLVEALNLADLEIAELSAVIAERIESTANGTIEAHNAKLNNCRKRMEADNAQLARWQCISTAPKDGTQILVYSRSHGYVAASWDIVEGGGHPENGPAIYWWVSDHCEFIDGPHDAPILWRPLHLVPDEILTAVEAK